MYLDEFGAAGPLGIEAKAAATNAGAEAVECGSLLDS
jgi:hypothetical protein